VRATTLQRCAAAGLAAALLAEKEDIDDLATRQRCEARRTDIKLFVKLPWWFTVEAPVGSYNPDWAIVKEVPGEAPRLYLVRETKGTLRFEDLDERERDKIKAGRSIFPRWDCRRWSTRGRMRRGRCDGSRRGRGRESAGSSMRIFGSPLFRTGLNLCPGDTEKRI